MLGSQMKPQARRFVIGVLMVLGSVLLFCFGLLMSMFSMAATGEGIGFFYFTAVVSLGIFIWGFRLIHKWAEQWKAYRTAPSQAILPSGLLRWLVVPVVSIPLLFMSGQISLAQREGYTFFLVLLLLVDGIYCACVRMPHYFLVDGAAFLFGAGYLAHAAFFNFLPYEVKSGSEIYGFPGNPAGFRIFSIVVILLFFHGALSIWGYWKMWKKGKVRT